MIIKSILRGESTVYKHKFKTPTVSENGSIVFRHPFNADGRRINHVVTIEPLDLYPMMLNSCEALNKLNCREEFRIVRRTKESVFMPSELTAENGGKKLMNGEFSIDREVSNPDFCGCGKCDFCVDFPDTPETFTEKIIVPWPIIKDIYAKAVEAFGKPATR